MDFLQRWLILDMDLDVSYNASEHEVEVYFDEDPDAPTVKWGWLEYVVFALCVPVALCLVVGLFMLSRRHERHKREKREAEKVAQYDCLRDKIKCKPWRHPDEQSRAFARSTVAGSVSRSVIVFGNSTTGPSGSALFKKSQIQTPGQTPFPEAPQGGACGFRKAHNGFYCVICCDAFNPGEPVYNSNNPECRHQIHMKCMDQWVEHKNICPVCSHPFVVLRPHDGDWMSTTKPPIGSITGLHIRQKWRSLRGSDNHRKEFASVIASCTRPLPMTILEEELTGELAEDDGPKRLSDLAEERPSEIARELRPSEIAKELEQEQAQQQMEQVTEESSGGGDGDLEQGKEKEGERRNLAMSC